MVSSSSVIPQGYGYVLGSGVSIGWLLMWQTIRVSAARKAAGIKYPQVYATPEQQAADKKALIYNCTQRSHANTLEVVPIMMFGHAVTGLVFPRFAAGCTTLWVVGRVLYTLGYSTGDPAKRQWGIVGSLASISMLLGSTYACYRIIVDGLF